MTQRMPLPKLIFPERFQGFFRRTQALYSPVLEDARAELATLAYPEIASSFFSYVVRENPQPSFMLLPLMYLGIADVSGGISQAHRNYLPVLLLTMEVCAVMDDTSDRTPQRSGRPTFAAAYGDHSATPLTASLVSLALNETAKRAPMLLEGLNELIVELGARELWEIHNRYPKLDRFDQWLDNRYAEVTPAVSFALDGALALNHQAALPPEVSVLFARIFQDVDDLVNVAEMRESEGENDDFKLGMVTLPLIAALQAHPELRSDVELLWSAYAAAQKDPNPQLGEQLAAVSLRYADPLERVRDGLFESGIPVTLQHIEQDAAQCVAATPAYLQPLIQELVLTFMNRVAHL